MARTAPRENVKVAYATLNAPRSRAPTVLATSSDKAKFVALESTWSASAHPKRLIIVAAFPGRAPIRTWRPAGLPSCPRYTPTSRAGAPLPPSHDADPVYFRAVSWHEPDP